MTRARWAAALLCLPGMAATLPAAAADIKMSYVRLADGAEALLYEPAQAGPKAHVALVNIHSFSSYLNHTSCRNMAERGYPILCGSTRFTNAEDDYKGFEDHAPAIKSAVARVKAIAGVTKVVLIGHSMGAPMMAFYQNVAQNGAKVCQGPEKIMPCDDANLRDLPGADGLVLLDPHYGEAAGTLTYVDPAIADEARPGKRDNSLDMFDKANGYDAKGSSYSAEFRRRFLAAQAARNARLTQAALQQWAALKADNGATLYQDDMAFFVPGVRARLFQPDVSMMQHSKKAYTLLKGDGTTPSEQLVSLREPSGGIGRALTHESTLRISLRRWLGDHAIRTTPDYDQTADGMTGIDWDSSATSTSTNVKTVTVPLLIMVMTGHYFIQTGELLMATSGSADKQMVGIEGAAHGIVPCERCAKVKGQFGDTVKRTYDYLDGWLAKRF